MVRWPDRLFAVPFIVESGARHLELMNNAEPHQVGVRAVGPATLVALVNHPLGAAHQGARTDPIARGWPGDQESPNC